MLGLPVLARSASGIDLRAFARRMVRMLNPCYDVARMRVPSLHCW